METDVRSRFASRAPGHAVGMAQDEEPEESATEPDRDWRERMQETNELAEELAPPHEQADERGSPSPNP